MDEGGPIEPGPGESAAGSQVPSRRESTGAARAGSCPRCESALTRDARFCPGCKTFLEAPDVGRLASPRRRLAASILDSMFEGGGLIGALLGPVAARSGLAAGVLGLISAGYWVLTLFLWSRGTTPAKRMLEMSVITEQGDPPGFWRMALRETIGKAISYAVLGLGVLTIPFDRNHQGWHDKMFDTFVVVDEGP